MDSAMREGSTESRRQVRHCNSSLTLPPSPRQISQFRSNRRSHKLAAEPRGIAGRKRVGRQAVKQDRSSAV